MKSVRAHVTDAPDDVYFSVKLPLTAACEAVKMARDLETAIIARSKISSLSNYFIYEASSDALLEPANMGK